MQYQSTYLLDYSSPNLTLLLFFRNAPGSELVMAMRGLQVNEMGNGSGAGQDQPKADVKLNHEVLRPELSLHFFP